MLLFCGNPSVSLFSSNDTSLSAILTFTLFFVESSAQINYLLSLSFACWLQIFDFPSHRMSNNSSEMEIDRLAKNWLFFQIAKVSRGAKNESQCTLWIGFATNGFYVLFWLLQFQFSLFLLVLYSGFMPLPDSTNYANYSILMECTLECLVQVQI